MPKRYTFNKEVLMMKSILTAALILTSTVGFAGTQTADRLGTFRVGDLHMQEQVSGVMFSDYCRVNVLFDKFKLKAKQDLCSKISKIITAGMKQRNGLDEAITVFTDDEWIIAIEIDNKLIAND
jgi:hypothetical protein